MAASCRFDAIPEALRKRLETEDLRVSPVVHLELAYLREIGRVTEGPDVTLREVGRGFGVTSDPTDFVAVVMRASDAAFSFTCDPFDRMIAAQAEISGADLATKDRLLREHLDFTIWD